MINLSTISFMKYFFHSDSFTNIAIAHILVVIADKFNIVRTCTRKNYTKNIAE